MPGEGIFVRETLLLRSPYPDKGYQVGLEPQGPRALMGPHARERERELLLAMWRKREAMPLCSTSLTSTSLAFVC